MSGLPASGASTAATPTPAGAGLQLTLATGAFAVCFAVFGSVSAMMLEMQRRLNLNEWEFGVALAVPVLLGSLGRIPLGILTDRVGGRLVFILVMLGSLPPALLMPYVRDFPELLACGFFFGLPLAVFPVGVAFVNGWYPPQRQGAALGVYGAGNIGQSFATFGAPVVVGLAGFAWGFWAFALLTVAWGLLFVPLARNAAVTGPRKTWADFVRPLANPMSWVLSLYYFLTFGGFVAMAIYLPKFLTGMFSLPPLDAGLRTAGFVVLATLMRPIGGALADRVGGHKVLLMVFPVTALMALFMACPLMSTFTVGALGMAVAIGLGNGAVFKLVPEYFPTAVGSVTGLVGAAGGLGGFFPPLVLGVIRQSTGKFTWGFVLLAIFCAICLLVCWKTGPRAEGRTTSAPA
jgi:NNP family nitrate/nitrite transporter-like MFS transporter